MNGEGRPEERPTHSNPTQNSVPETDDTDVVERRRAALARLRRAHCCRPGKRCPEHHIDVDPENVGQMLHRLFGGDG